MVTRVKGSVSPIATEVFLTSGTSVEDAISGISSGLSSYDTYTELRSQAGTSGQIVYLKGRNAIGDLGDGFFEWRSGDQSANVAADPIEILYVAPTSDATGASGAWYRINDGVYFTSWAGLGDGTDQAELFADIAAQMKEYETWVFDRDFTTSAGVIINTVPNLTIDGTGCQVTEIGEIQDTFRFLTCDRVRISGFRVFGDEDAASFDYTQSIGPSYYFIKFNACNDCIAEKITVSSKSAGFWIDGGQGNKIYNCKHVGIFTTEVSSANKVNGVNSYFINAGKYNTVENCSSINSGTGILTGSDAQFAVIRGNYILHDNDNSIYVSSGAEVLVEGNTCEESYRGSGIKCRANLSRVVNNTITKAILGITMSGENGVDPDTYSTNGNLSIVEGNMIVSCGIGINIDVLVDENTGTDEYCRDVMVTNNQLVSCGGPDYSGATVNSAPIRIKGGPGHVVRGNFINGRQDVAVTKGIFVFVVAGVGKSGYDISHNTFRGDWTDCIWVYGVTDSTIAHNKSISDTVSRLIYAQQCDDNIITGNYTKTGEAVRLASCDGNIVSYNKGASNLLGEFSQSNALYGNSPTASPSQKFSISFGTVRTPNTEQSTLVTLSLRAHSAGDGVNPGEIFVDINALGGTSGDYTLLGALASANADGNFSVTETLSFVVPPGGSYTVRNERDPDGLNAITECVETFI